MVSFTEFFSSKGIAAWNILPDSALQYIVTNTNGTLLADYALGQTTGIAVLLPYRIITIADNALPSTTVTIGSFAAYNYYHFLTRIMQELAAQIRSHYGLRRSDFRISVNSSLPEKESAALAHLGWIGKSGLLVNPIYGSAVLIGLLLFPKIDELYQILLHEAEFKQITSNPVCGSCSACIDACPTRALDNGFSKELCLQYWMSRGGMPDHLKVYRENRLYGCDVCIKECPYTQRAQDNVTMEELREYWKHRGEQEEQQKQQEQQGHSRQLFNYIESQLTEAEKRPGSAIPLDLITEKSIFELKCYFKGTALGFSWISFEDFRLYTHYLREKAMKGYISD